MPLKTTQFDPAEYLRSVEEVETFLEPEPGDTPEIRADLLETGHRAARRWGLIWPKDASDA